MTDIESGSRHAGGPCKKARGLGGGFFCIVYKNKVEKVGKSIYYDIVILVEGGTNRARDY